LEVTALRSSPIAIIPGGMVVGATVDVVIVGPISVEGAGGTCTFVGVADVTLGASVAGVLFGSGALPGRVEAAKNAIPPIAAAASAKAATPTPKLEPFLWRARF
jgi:hypothetical protein